MFKLIEKNTVASILHSHVISYGTPFNLSYVWSLGAMLGFCLVLQMATGIMLAMHYNSDVDSAFQSIQEIMTEVKFGWYIRYLHANGASMFFIFAYLHIFKALFYGSYNKPRHLIWWFGLIIFILLMATAFLGYVLPWGQMSFWGATVITNLFSAVPLIGQHLVVWLWGGFGVDEPLLQRFFSLHYLLPFIIAALTICHLVFLHIDGSSNPVGTSKASITTFFPTFGVKDLTVLIIVLAFIIYIVSLYPNVFGHPDNDLPAQAMVTPLHIVPEWYFLPFYAILRSIPNKAGGVFAMFASLIILFFLPWLSNTQIRNTSFRPIFAFFLFLFFLDMLFLGWVGQLGAESPYVNWGLLGTTYYFAFFLILMPIIGYFESKASFITTK